MSPFLQVARGYSPVQTDRPVGAIAQSSMSMDNHTVPMSATLGTFVSCLESSPGRWLMSFLQGRVATSVLTVCHHIPRLGGA